MNSTLTLSGWGRRLGRSLMRLKTNEQTIRNENNNMSLRINKWNVVRGDAVHVIQGPQKGQQGKVLKVIRKLNRVIIEGVNMKRRNEKSRIPGIPGKIVVKPVSLHYSNVMLTDPTNNEPTKISRRYLEDGTKVRISKLTGNIIPKPNPLSDRKLRTSIIGMKDTLTDEAQKVTFNDYEKYSQYIYKNYEIKKEKQNKDTA